MFRPRLGTALFAALITSLYPALFASLGPTPRRRYTSTIAFRRALPERRFETFDQFCTRGAIGNPVPHVRRTHGVFYTLNVLLPANRPASVPKRVATDPESHGQ